MTIKYEKWTWAVDVMRKCDIKWTTIVTVLQPKSGRRNRGRQRIRWRDNIRAFVGQAGVH